jgi:hypothetical protein
MAVPTSNITLLSIQQEFGGAAASRRLKNYYGAAAGVPASGPIKFKDFVGKSAAVWQHTGAGSYKNSTGPVAFTSTYIEVPNNYGNSKGFANSTDIGTTAGASYRLTGTIRGIGNTSGTSTITFWQVTGNSIWAGQPSNGQVIQINEIVSSPQTYPSSYLEFRCPNQYVNPVGLAVRFENFKLAPI